MGDSVRSVTGSCAAFDEALKELGYARGIDTPWRDVVQDCRAAANGFVGGLSEASVDALDTLLMHLPEQEGLS